mgnify:CR=1 FL=1
MKYKKDAFLTEDEARAQQEEWDSEMSEAVETAIETTQAVEEEAETGGTVAGKLYLCATPIGNLQDMTPRVIETLQAVDLIAAEDTRNSMKLMNHFEIHTPMTSYHEYNKIEKAKYLIEQLQEG